MNLKFIENLRNDLKVAFALTIAEKVFSVINHDDDKYIYGREALDKCWL